MFQLVLNQKAENLARQFTVANFKVTNGWLKDGKKQNQIYLKKIIGDDD